MTRATASWKNLVEKVHGNFAGGIAQVVEDGGGGKLGNTRKVLSRLCLLGFHRYFVDLA